MERFGISSHDRQSRARRAFTMVESMLLVTILGMTAAVVGQSLAQMSKTTVSNNDALDLNDALLSQMEILRSTYSTVSPTPTSSTPWTGTNTVSVDGHTYTITSTISWAVPTGSTSVATFMRLQVSSGNYSMSTYVSE